MCGVARISGVRCGLTAFSRSLIQPELHVLHTHLTVAVNGGAFHARAFPLARSCVCGTATRLSTSRSRIQSGQRCSLLRSSEPQKTHRRARATFAHHDRAEEPPRFPAAALGLGFVAVARKSGPLTQRM